MPEAGKNGEEATTAQAAAATEAATPSPPSVERVSWPVEDPSEFRPELGPGGQLENIGKDTENFRAYYEVF